MEREFSFELDGDRVRGRWDRVDIEPVAGDGAAPAVGTPRRAPQPTADVVTPTLGMMGRERVTITDYKSSDVRDPAKARQRARESLQLQIYAMGYEAMTGRLPTRVALHFLGSGLIGKVDVDPKRLAKARERIAAAAVGIRARDYTPKPEPRLHLLRVPRHLPGERRPLRSAWRDDRACARLDAAPPLVHRRRPGGVERCTAGYRGWERRSTMRLEPLGRPWATQARA